MNKFLTAFAMLVSFASFADDSNSDKECSEEKKIEAPVDGAAVDVHHDENHHDDNKQGH
jgi:hypothetical protein